MANNNDVIKIVEVVQHAYNIADQDPHIAYKFLQIAAASAAVANGYTEKELKKTNKEAKEIAMLLVDLVDEVGRKNNESH